MPAREPSHDGPAARFGLLLESFAPPGEPPDPAGVLEYARRAERLGFGSLWTWDHVVLGSRRPFEVLDSLTLLSAVAASTTTIRIGTGILVLPLRNPALLAKAAATLDLISGGRLTLGLGLGWYRREFELCGVPFEDRGQVFERSLDLIDRLWSGEPVSGEAGALAFRDAVMRPRPSQRPRPTVLIGGYGKRALGRAAAWDGWFTSFHTPVAFRRSWERVRSLAEEAGRDPDELRNVATLPICVDDSFEAADRRVRAFLDGRFDFPAHGAATIDSAIRGRPEQCAEQLIEHLEAGVEHVALLAEGYRADQVDRVASDVLPLIQPVASTGRAA